MANDNDENMTANSESYGAESIKVLEGLDAATRELMR